jgi:hypothetical protein
MSDLLPQQAALAAQRVDPQVTEELGGSIIVTEILTLAFKWLLSCLNRENANPAQVQAAVKEENGTNRKALLRRTARRIRGNAEQPMTRQQSFELAKASIEQALAMDEETAMACAVSVPNDLFVDGE